MRRCRKVFQSRRSGVPDADAVVVVVVGVEVEFGEVVAGEGVVVAAEVDVCES